MKKVIFIMSLLYIFLFLVYRDNDVNASKNNNYILFKESVTYYETSYENGKVYKKELPRDKYQAKVQEAKRNKQSIYKDLETNNVLGSCT